ncbi:LLM class flavin-dependent oxidoreductase [Paenibacillus allorhizosphaerae]|uniref:Nitrilotriacetate monooxygenase component A n=1 Tax=Paenibacillus allorhizosphaerae TaxID=2849866 RepID=A0ABM8VA57_9BACL|nr:LLM class flavin-dependent oxidoreductase [Paenibacillus allorhizosphaerae]CAG7615313.1 Nitrilotriacetate monooxygenase component A [Paenibacillus allorhizosphaerae]
MSHSTARRVMHLGVFLDVSGHYASAWRHPSTQADRFFDLGYYKQLAGKAEQGKLDMVFLSDRYGIPDRYGNRFDTTVRSISSARLDPVTLITAIAAITERIGVAATSSTSFTEPFLTARQFASIDHLSGGRVGWNVVTSTSDNEARNFSKEGILEHQARYERAREFLEAANGLWDSWEDGALRFDKAGGVFADAGKIHYLHYQGEHFQVRGPLDVPRSPQGRPVIIQAGSSEAGRDFAARFAEVIFTAQPTIDAAQSFYADMKRRAAVTGRSPEHLKIMPGVMPIVAESEVEARRIEASLSDLVDPLAGLALLSDQINYDLSVHPLDEPLPELQEVSGMQSRLQLVAKMLQSERLTLRELGRFYAGSRMHRKVVGSPEQVADFMEEWFTGGACDGFNLMFPFVPDSMEQFIDLVVPELQRRGLFRTEYTGRTLRDHLGLPRP